MPLASQCLGYLNRASLIRRQLDHQALTSSRRTLRTPAGTRRPDILCDPDRRIVQPACLPKSTRGQDLRLGSSAAARCLPEHPHHPPHRGNRNLYNDEEESSLLPIATGADKQLANESIPPPIESDDVATWAHQLASAQRTQGNEGVLRVWSVLARSRSLFEVNGSDANWVWKTILDASLASDRQLERINKYAQWLLDTHSARWPHLYEHVVLYCLRHRQYRRAFSWHMRLMPSFGPGLDDFSSLLRSHIGDPDTNLQSTLESIYMTSLHRNLYDSVISHLYETGNSALCMKWRDTFLRYHDLPRPIAASQPFLRFLMNYYPNKTLCLEEQVVAGLVSSASRSFQQDPSLWEALSADHENEAGGKGRPFNDTIGARWFASSWVPLDFAIHAVHGLGVRVLGPMSLQSIALREKTTAAILSRLRQLQKLNIGIGHSTYARAVRNFAEKGEDTLMSALLESDIHPDVFDDMDTQQEILRAALQDGDWQVYRLLLAIQPAVAQDSIESTSNHLLQEHLKHQHNQRVLALLDDMRAMNIDVTHPTMQVVHEHLIRGLPRRISSPEHGRQVSEIVAIATRLASRQKFLSSTFWERALFRLGEAGRLDELERLTASIVGHYQGHAAQRRGLISIHRTDSPMALPDDASLEVPTDLPIAHDWHPIRRIFVNRVLQAAIIRWGFQRGLNASPREQHLPSTPGAGPSEYWAARGVRLLRGLRDHGIPIEVALVRTEVIHCLARYCARGQGQAGSNGRESPDLALMRELFNGAYGGQLLPNSLELRDLVYQTERQLPRHTKTFTSIPGWDRRRGHQSHIV